VRRRGRCYHTPVRSRRESLGFALGLVAVIAVAAALGLRDLGAPGLYYDEAIQAVPAAEFVRASERPFELPGTRNARIAGRWFPVFTQPYMGALKSQLLIPVFAVFGASVGSLRAATFGFGVLGLALAMLFARSLLGTPIALLGGLLLAVDPAFLFVSRHDWGSFALGLACRCGGLWLAVGGFERRSAARLAGAGIALGLGVFNKIDVGAFLAAAACAIALVAPRALGERLRRRPGEIGLLAAGLVLGAAPVLWSLWKTLGVVERAFRKKAGLAGDLPEKLTTWSTLFDGSHFERLMLAGGRF
jgi:predicted membrane-bound mannosyltransferase